MELYIDTGDREANKQLFDRPHEDREGIERELGVPLRWERLDNARASRVVTYRPGSIEATDKELEELQDWAVETAIKFRRVF